MSHNFFVDVTCFLPPPPLKSTRHARKKSYKTFISKTIVNPQCVSHPKPQNPLRTLISILNPFKATQDVSPSEDSDGLHARLRARDEDDGVKARLAARRERVTAPALPAQKRRRSETKISNKPAPRARTYGIPEGRLYEFVCEAIRRREEVGNGDIVALLPYDLQRKVFDEIISSRLTKVEAHERNEIEDEGEAEGGWVSAVWGFAGYAVRLVTFRDLWKEKGANEDSVSAVAYAAAVERDSRMAIDADVGTSAASAYAAAAALATSALASSPSRAELAGLKAAVAAARAINNENEANVFLDTIGVRPLVAAASVLSGSEKATALTALANLAIIVPKSRTAMLNAGENIVRMLSDVVHQSGRFGAQAVGGMWHTEAVVSGTHLLGSLALARNAGQEARKLMACDKELIRGLTRLAGGLKNGEPEGAARAARRALGAIGVNNWKPRMPGQRGLRILCIDGGGTRAIMAFETLKQLKRITGCEIHEMFDIIGGTSTGAIVAASIGIVHKTVEEVEVLYRDMIGKIFAKHPVNGPKMLLTRAYYDTSVLESTLKQECGKGIFIDSLAEENMNRVFVVSSVMSRNPKELHIFRNYTYPIGHESRYDGTTEAQLWEGLRASSAAPTFFSEIRVNGELHADGAIVANNPTAVALHETKCMYPGVPIELVVSLGNGLSPAAVQEENEDGKKNVGWGDVVGSIVASATATEVVHHAMQDLFPEDKYFRFNPTTENTQIDETHPETLATFVKEAHEYIASNREDFERVARILRPKTPRSLWRRFRDALSKELQELQSGSDDDLYLPN
eukprot:TRINITY_DN5387_c0_g1_i1.p1 TRINITY_DN5387_c0_g1~~TRINITY_DN5387_c0_g1_i1.p1  ORF type:complete len:798 (+),score=107.91 TRINITY_DN5387_c0_g1_i1:3283-5676(+)